MRDINVRKWCRLFKEGKDPFTSILHLNIHRKGNHLLIIPKKIFSSSMATERSENKRRFTGLTELVGGKFVR